MFTLIDESTEQDLGSFDGPVPRSGELVTLSSRQPFGTLPEGGQYRVERVAWDLRIGSRENSCHAAVYVRRL